MEKKQISLVAYAVTLGGMLPTKITWLGINLSSTNLATMYLGIQLILVYLIHAYLCRATQDLTNTITTRQLTATLHRFEFNQQIKSILKKSENNSHLKTILGDLSFTESDFLTIKDSNDCPYQASALGLNKEAKFYELKLPTLIALGAMLSCVYFSIKNIHWVH